MSRRTKVGVTALAVVALTLTACGGPSNNANSGLKGADNTIGQADINPQDPSKVKDGGEFRWPVDQLPDNWNYYQLDGTVADGRRMIDTMMPNLFKQKADSTIEVNKDYLEDAKLASTDPQVVEYKLNAKAKWSDGTALSWQDFEGMWKALNGTDKTFEVAGTTGYEDIEKVEKGATDQDVKVTFKKKFAEWKGALFSPLYPKSAHATAEEFNKGWAEAPKVTGGPFKIGTIDRTGKTVTVVRDAAWWGTKPKLEKITFRQVDRPALADALANGQIDYFDIGSSIDNFTRAKSMQGVTIRQAITPDYSHITFNGADSSILKDPKLRVALTRGIDTKVISTALLGQMLKGEAQVTGNHFFLLGSAGYKDNSAVASFDKEAAKKQLDELGWKLEGEFRKKDGKELVVRYVIPTPNPISDQIAKLVQSQLKEVGAKVDIQAVTSTDFFKQYVNVGNFDMTGFRWLSSATPISDSKGIYTLDPASTNQNYGRIGSEEVNKLLEQANGELDDAKRLELANEADKKIWELGHQLPLYQSPGAVAVKSNVANFGAVAYANRPYDYINMGFTE
ncbi:peptide/nickel transport system substrate-binding protein [Lentzea albidocapillata subsp. violacea]|uniref:Peptide/nickel transport system substrate-binding protein n=1 Tax=Lentzea albidocapillata subsp. violacea TaxID=128104 RepID=A0A1G9RJH4_9PSEU|nr:ABC transporter family substrate-binding protein [Lentzea albidocapillata]SDM23374.1 peptide/nickel transport system substrate-binding protein [Lentzea albidocapillata subsp. violacea]